jgi:uncharacterized protein with PIN domain
VAWDTADRSISATTFSYALAKSLNCPLLFIRDDFTTTDITSAL